MPGGILPIIALTETLNFPAGILSGGSDLLDLDDFFATFVPLPGSTLIDNKYGQFPFANQQVAANAVITQPLVISYRMICPAQNELGYPLKLATMTALQASLAQHGVSGGTYICATPSFFYTNCVMLGMRDTSDSRSQQAQNTYQLDFWQPLLTLQSALQAQNNLMSQVTGQTPVPATDGAVSWSGLSPTTGNPASIAGPSVIPAAAPLAGAGTAAPGMGGPLP